MRISDSHTDFLTSIENQEEREAYVEKIKRSGVLSVCCAVFTTEKKLTTCDIEKYAKELEDLRGKYKINLLLTIEDLGFVKSISELQKILNLHPFSTTLTWNKSNQFAGGAHSTKGLSHFGKTYVEILEQNKIFVDTAHMSRKSFWDFCNVTTRPIFNSHSNIFTLKHHKRNLTDNQIEKIVTSNGFLGLTFYDEFVSNNKISSRNLAIQFDYLVKNFGYKNLGLGTDFYGISASHLPQDLKNYGEIQNLVFEMKLLGHSDEIIDSLLFKNFDNFFHRNNTW